jgi:hypothetical protein
MKKFSVVIPVVLVLASLASAQSLTPADRERALKYLEETRQSVVAATNGLSAEQWNFKPAPDRWSVAEVTEHIAAAEDFLFGLLTEQAMKAPARPAGEDAKAIDDMVMKNIPDRTKKAQAPEPLKPTNRFGSPEGSLKHFAESRQKTEDFLKKTDDLRAHAMDSPLGAKLDGYEWILFVAAHSDRHTKQINEVKADPNFPKK